MSISSVVVGSMVVLSNSVVELVTGSAVVTFSSASVVVIGSGVGMGVADGIMTNSLRSAVADGSGMSSSISLMSIIIMTVVGSIISDDWASDTPISNAAVTITTSMWRWEGQVLA